MGIKQEGGASQGLPGRRILESKLQRAVWKKVGKSCAEYWGCTPPLMTPRAIVKALLPVSHQALEDKAEQEDVVWTHAGRGLSPVVWPQR